MSNSELIDAFKLFLRAQDLADISIVGYTQDLNYFNKWMADLNKNEISLLNLSLTDLQAFRDTLFQFKRQKPATLNRRIQVIKRFYQWCQKTKSALSRMK